MKLLLILLTFLMTPLSYGAIELIEAKNASNTIIGEDKSIKVFGGTSGTCTTGTGTCDSCAAATGLTACNIKTISSSTELTVSFKVTSDLTGTGTVKVYESGGNQVTLLSASTGVGKDDTASFTVSWGTLCANMNSAQTDCSVSESESFTVGIDVDNNGLADVESGQILFQVHAAAKNTVLACNDSTNTDGVCAFTAGPGDRKVVIEDILTEGSFPTLTGLSFTHIRVYYKEGGYPTSPNDLYEDLGISQDSQGFFLSDKTIGGLTNNTTYYFRTATVDEAGNVGYFLDDSEITAKCPTNDDLTCPYIATPAEVFGLLEDDINCFIATAAFGSPWHSQVNDLRAFRDRFLKTNRWGQLFVDFYYEYGPYAARAIQDKDSIRAVVRVGLFPFWLFAKVATDYGFPAALFLFTLLAAALLKVLQTYRRRLLRRAS